MTRQEIKARARKQLGGSVFENNWLYAVLFIVVISAINLVPNVVPAIGQIVALLIAGPMLYASSFVFLKQARDGEQMKIEDVFSGFKGDFSGVFLTYLMTAIFTFLWGLLFIVPGIIKAYSYSMVYYIKADHPEYDWRKCLSESRRIMRGHKLDLFILELSFIGWQIVGSLCLGVGTLWVTAYMSASKAQFYESIKG